MTEIEIAFDEVRMPDPTSSALNQDQEWCDVVVGGRERRIRFHDYAQIYKIPGLYEHLFYEELECCSPETVTGLLSQELDRDRVDPTSLSVLDVGAGNGMVAERFQELGASTIVGVDLLPEAALAADRDRPDVYDDYVVCDLTDLAAGEQGRLEDANFNCLVTVAALGFGDMPPQALKTAYDFIEPGGWVALTIKEDFLNNGNPSGFDRLIEEMIDTGTLDLRTQHRYRHRVSCQGEELYYLALIGTKAGEIENSALV